MIHQESRMVQEKNGRQMNDSFTDQVKQIEDLSLNAWPSHKMELYDGWILRFSYFYTHRTNSVEQFGPETLPWSVKIPFCESEYARLGSPAVFKISPLISPNFDFLLENRGYQIQHGTRVMTMSLAGWTDPGIPAPDVTFMEGIPEQWIHGLFDLKGMGNGIHRRIVPSMYRAIPKETVCACVLQDGRVAATGLGILDRNYIGIYAVHVAPELRRRGIARQLCLSLLREGIKKGADTAYLQVVEGNDPAGKLYEALGFSHLYSYWFRVQPY